MAQLVEAMHNETGGRGFDSRRGGGVIGTFRATLPFCPHVVALGSRQPVTEVGTKALLGVKAAVT